ncbi:hypothetical protein HMPREF1981_02519 [Bacteroides pyogenes F0041]|uniref:Uncharacterized protein n=1 Tax=Bacteroides pyogenes F0041 TaxID=1321819 RepID=U2DW77_9BACE|nr:hypothetical protein HMPREF1981_02519 [Bacteroides pyogenes F0041]
MSVWGDFYASFRWVDSFRFSGVNKVGLRRNKVLWREYYLQ